MQTHYLSYSYEGFPNQKPTLFKCHMSVIIMQVTY